MQPVHHGTVAVGLNREAVRVECLGPRQPGGEIGPEAACEQNGAEATQIDLGRHFRRKRGRIRQGGLFEPEPFGGLAKNLAQHQVFFVAPSDAFGQIIGEFRGVALCAEEMPRQFDTHVMQCSQRQVVATSMSRG